MGRKVCCGLPSPHFKLFFGNHGHNVLRAKEEKDHPDCFQCKFQKPASVMVWGGVSAHGKGNLHIREGTINAERYIQQDDAKPHSARVTTAWLRSKRVVWVLDWPACSPDRSPTENVGRIMKRKIRQQRPWTVEQLKSYIKQV
uniref:Uncharacterized protein n=1 Tax=Sander lucioperca TaxID=283035 RepID=A0A8C9ZKA5_SANLU